MACLQSRRAALHVWAVQCCHLTRQQVCIQGCQEGRGRKPAATSVDGDDGHCKCSCSASSLPGFTVQQASAAWPHNRLRERPARTPGKPGSLVGGAPAPAVRQPPEGCTYHTTLIKVSSLQACTRVRGKMAYCTPVRAVSCQGCALLELASKSAPQLRRNNKTADKRTATCFIMHACCAHHAAGGPHTASAGKRQEQQAGGCNR